MKIQVNFGDIGDFFSFLIIFLMSNTIVLVLLIYEIDFINVKTYFTD